MKDEDRRVVVRVNELERGRWRGAGHRLALIFFVRRKTMQTVLDTTRGWMAGRPEFGKWQTRAPDGQLRCTLRWEGQARKEGRLTIFHVHLPRA